MPPTIGTGFGRRCLRRQWPGRSFVGFLALVLMAAAPFAAAQPQATTVSVDTVHIEPMSQTIPVIGRFTALQSGVVAARTEGPVERMVVNVGDRVDKGGVLAVLDQARLGARLDLVKRELNELEAREATARAVERLAKLELDRFEKLRNTAAFNQSLYDARVQELEVARSNRREAEARIARGRVSLELAEIELRDSVIRAPFPGTVTLRHTSEGAWLKAGDPVVALINGDALEIEADVPAARLGGIRAGARVDFMLDDGNRYSAVVRAVIPDVSSTARTQAVRIVPEFGGARPTLAANQPVMLRLPAGGEAKVVSVHKDAVMHRGGQDMVYLVRDGLAKPRTVKLGDAVGSRFQVLEGLAPGDIVVIRGNERLRPGESVRYQGQSGAPLGPDQNS